MDILFFSENFPPETNAAATRVYERAVYWTSWGHNVTVITCAPNFPHGKLFDGYANAWYQTEIVSGIKVVRVKTYIAANQGVIRRSLDFISFLISGSIAGLLQPASDDQGHCCFRWVLCAGGADDQHLLRHACRCCDALSNVV